MLVVGGMSSLTGAVSGVIAVTAIVEFLRFLERGIDLGGTTLSLPEGSQEIGLGILMALILVFRPNGLSGGRELLLIRRRTTVRYAAGNSAASSGGRNAAEKLNPADLRQPS